MTKRFMQTIRQAISDFERVLYHAALVGLSALIAMSLPFVAQGFLTLWARIKTDAVLLVSAEIAVAVCLIAFFNHLGRNREHQRLAKAASGAGLLEFLPAEGHFCEKRLGHLIKRQGLARNVMVIGSTGNSFSQQDRALHAVLKNCLEAKVLLLNPCTEEARTRARSIMEPNITSETLRQQVRQSIEFLKLLRAFQKNIKLKLYPDVPTIKLAILGDELWLQHYHTSLDVSTMPMYAFKHNTREHGLYTLFYQHFMMRWENPQIPEYNLETDELVYRARNGREERREPFQWDQKLPTEKADSQSLLFSHTVGDTGRPPIRVRGRNVPGSEWAPLTN